MDNYLVQMLQCPKNTLQPEPLQQRYGQIASSFSPL
jgi:hypothetical protein